VSIVATAILLMILGWYFSQFRPMQEVVLRVDDTPYKMSYYVNMLNYYGQGNPSSYLADNLPDFIKRNQIVKTAAEELGVEVTDEELKEELKSREPAVSKKYGDAVRAEMVIEKLREEYFDTKVPETAEHRHVMAMMLESESQAKEVIEKIKGGEEFGKLAAELSLDGYTQSKEGDLGWRPEGIIEIITGNALLEEKAFTAEVGALNEPIYDEEEIKNVGYWIVRVIEKNEETTEAHVQGILLGNEAEAKSAKERLDKGENFADLAKEISQDINTKENGGDIGMISPGTMHPDVEEFVFNKDVELRTLSDPIRDETVTTDGGYWLIKVEAVEEKKVEGENRDVLKSNLLGDWLNELMESPEYTVEDLLDDTKKAWAVQQAS